MGFQLILMIDFIAIWFSIQCLIKRSEHALSITKHKLVAVRNNQSTSMLVVRFTVPLPITKSLRRPIESFSLVFNLGFHNDKVFDRK